jgi:hypothetical protein
MSARSLHKLTTKGNSEMPDDKVRIPGLPPIPVVSDAEAENSDFLVCAPLTEPMYFADNFKGICCHCGRDIQYRWHAPRKPKRLCMECFVKLENKVAVESEETKQERPR